MKNGTVLIVDDMVVNRMMMKSLINDICYVVMAGSGNEALNIILKMDNPPDLILLDLFMRGMSGLEFMEVLRDTVYADIPIMVITASIDKQYETRAIALGAIDFITRPYNPDTFKIRVKNNLDLIRLRAEEKTNRQTPERVAEELVETLACVTENAKTGGALASEERIAKLRGRAGILVHNMLKSNKYRQTLINHDYESVIRAMPVHDIGKIGIPESILYKPDKLTVDEFEIIKTHTVIGGDIIQRIMKNSGETMFFKNCYDICRNHHERWDGKGYPDGLAAERIPLPARIAALLDSYDALTRDKPYKKAGTHREAVDIITAGSATQFDPYLIGCFLDAHERFIDD